MPELEEVKSRAAQIYYPLGAEWFASTRTWIMPNGSRLKLRFLESDDDADKYQGHSYTWACFDEAGNWVLPDPIDKIRATLRSAHGINCRLLSTANPGGKGHQWLKARYIDPAPPLTPFYDELKKTWRVFIPSRLSDNKILCKNDPTYIDRLAGSGPSWLVKAWLEGDWNSVQEGAIFKREYWKYYREAPWCEAIGQSWDTGFKDGEENDYSVCTTWGVANNGFYLLHRFKEKLQFPELKKAVITLAAKFNPTYILVEDKASGQSLVQEMQRETRLPVLPFKIDRDKVARANAVTPIIEAGKVYLPENEPWVFDYTDEMAVFPHGAHDDDVDSTTQFLLYQNQRKPLVFDTLPTIIQKPNNQLCMG